MAEVISQETRNQALQAQKELQAQRSRLELQVKSLTTASALRGINRSTRAQRREQINSIQQLQGDIDRSLQETQRLVSLPTAEDVQERTSSDIKLARKLANQKTRSGKSIPIAAIEDKNLRKLVVQIREGITDDELIRKAEAQAGQSFSPDARREIIETQRLLEKGATLQDIGSNQSLRPEIRAGSTLQELELNMSIAPKIDEPIREVGILERIETTRAERQAQQSLSPKNRAELRQRQIRQNIARGIRNIPSAIDTVTERLPISTSAGLPFGKGIKTRGEARESITKNLENKIDNINERYKKGLISDRQALEEIRRADKEFNTISSILDIPKNIVIGALIGTASTIPLVGSALTATFISDALLRRKTLLSEIKKYPESFAVNTISFVAGGGAASLVKGKLKFNGKRLIEESRRLMKDRRGAVDTEEVGQIFGGKRRKRQQQLLQQEEKPIIETEARKISREEALELFRRKSRSEQLDILKKALTKDKDRVILTPEIIERMKRFMKEGGLDESQINDRLLELYRQQQLKLLEIERADGIIDDVTFNNRRGILERQKQQLIDRLTAENSIREKIKVRQEKLQSPKVRNAQSILDSPKVRTEARIKVRESQFSGSRLRSEGATNVKSLQRSSQFSRQSLGQRYANAQKSRQSPRSLSSSSFKSSPLVGQSFSPASSQSSQSRSSLRSSPRLNFRSSSLLSISSKSGLGNRGRRPERGRRPKPRVPKKPFGPDEDGSFSKRKGKPFGQINQEGYLAYYKRGGKFYKIGRNPVTKEQAKDSLAYVVDQSLARSGKIVKTNRPARRPTFRAPSGYFARVANKFSNYRISKGKRISTPNQLIEKKSFGLDTTNEVRKIQAARFISQRKSGFGKVKRLISFGRRR